jgi:hypothetical protein
VTESENESNERLIDTPPYYQRFNIQVNREEAEKRFINRILNKIEQDLGSLIRYHQQEPYKTAMYNVASKLGLKYDGSVIHNYLRSDFNSCLLSLEALYEVFVIKRDSYAERLSGIIQYCLYLSETDLGITWRNGVFWPSGAKSLDEDLVNVNLKWLSDLRFQTVIVPFEKGLRHFLEASKQPEKLADTVTDMYEAMEAMAKIATGRDKDLSANKEKFISVLELSYYYKKMLSDYIEYANQYRHAIKPGEKREIPKRNEVEAFYYTTGLFIRLSIQQLTTK